jgi:hypothetical protein
MDSIICAARDVTHQEWEALRALYVKAFVAMSANVGACDLALMGNILNNFGQAYLIVISHNLMRKTTRFVCPKMVGELLRMGYIHI